VIIAIIYYLHDIPKFKRIRAEMEFATHCAVNIIQNISQNRSDKRITSKDLSYTRCFVGLSLYPGKSSYAVSGSGVPARRPTATFNLWYFYYIKGTGHNKCKVCWCWDSGYVNTSPDSSDFGVFISSDKSYSVVVYKAGDSVNSWEIYPSLTIEEGEEKIILDSCYWGTNAGAFADGRSAATVPVGRRFGLYVATPKPARKGANSYFNTIVIFTPKPGLFDETSPDT
jgi:hypothetical protein